MRQGSVKNYETELKRVDGETLWVSMNTKVTRDQGGNIVYEGFLTDITERKKAEEALLAQGAGRGSEQGQERVFGQHEP